MVSEKFSSTNSKVYREWMAHWLFCHTEISQFLMADISFNIACKELKIAQIAQLNPSFQLLHLVHIHLFRESCRKKSTRQSRKVLWVVLSSPFFKEIWKNGIRGSGRMFAHAKGKQEVLTTKVTGTVYWSYPILTFGIVACTFLPRLLWVKSYANEERCNTMTSAKIRLLHIVMVSWILCACYKDTHPRYFRSSFLFWCVFNRQHEHDMIECAFSFYSLLKASSNRCVFVENGQPVGVDGRPKWIEMYAISNENVLDWIRPRIRAMHYWASK